MFQTPELKLDKEFEDLLFTSTDCTPLAVPLVYRKIRQHPTTGAVKCPGCNAKASGIIEGERTCPYCDGLGYLWDESIIKGWIYLKNNTKVTGGGNPLEMGESDFNTFYLATKKDLLVVNDDYVRTIKLDSNKNIVMPLTYVETYKVYDSKVFASNQTNSEFNVAKIGSTMSLSRHDNITY